MTVDLALEARRLERDRRPAPVRNRCRRSDLARHGRETVRWAFIREAARDGVVSIATSVGAGVCRGVVPLNGKQGKA